MGKGLNLYKNNNNNKPWDKRRSTASLGSISHSYKSRGNPCYTTNSNKGLTCSHLGALVIWINSSYLINNHYSNLKVSQFMSFCYNSDGYILVFQEKGEKRLRVPARRSTSLSPTEKALKVFPPTEDKKNRRRWSPFSRHSSRFFWSRHGWCW